MWYVPMTSTERPNSAMATGFEVFSVSLDSDIPRWEAAIKKDGPWIGSTT